MTQVLNNPGRRLFLALALAGGFALPARAASHPRLQLMMARRKGCVWCARWDREIGTVYGRHPEGRAAPLLFVDIDGAYPDGLALDRTPWLTPSFILLADGVEIARYEGYPGAEKFFPILREMLEQAGIRD